MPGWRDDRLTREERGDKEPTMQVRNRLAPVLSQYRSASGIAAGVPTYLLNEPVRPAAIRSASREDSRQLSHPCKTAQTPQRAGALPISILNSNGIFAPRSGSARDTRQGIYRDRRRDPLLSEPAFSAAPMHQCSIGLEPLQRTACRLTIPREFSGASHKTCRHSVLPGRDHAQLKRPKHAMK